MRLHTNGGLLTLPENIILGWEWMEAANTPAYYDKATITAVKNFIVQTPKWKKVRKMKNQHLGRRHLLR